jgi:hypothetical protein
MRRGRPQTPLRLTEDEREPLERCAPSNGGARSRRDVRALEGSDTESGRVISEFHQRHRAREFRKFLTTMTSADPRAWTST